MESEHAFQSERENEFPYISYKKYLIKRGEDALAEHVTWNTHHTRTKNKLNTYKLDIQMYTPEYHSILTKNEAHVRMASSSWYVSKILIWYIPVVIMVLLAGSLLNVYMQNRFTISNIFLMLYNLLFSGILILPLMNLLLLFFFKNNIVKFIHYQRLREVYFTLVVYDKSRPLKNKRLADMQSVECLLSEG
jgi:hypothetical protein